jgi:pimeloyl-ACP methyl ester carboxylesterase
VDELADERERSLTRPDGRVVAWTESGDPGGRPLLRVPGTPGSRWAIRADRTPWTERGLRVLTTERPGYGASTRLPGRRFAEHADDLAAVLGDAGIDQVHVIGGSGSTPHLLAFCARHPDRVRAASNLVGTAPLEPDEVEQMIGLNAAAHGHATAGDRAGLEALLGPVREQLLADPLGAFREVMDTAPEADKAVMADPLWQEGFTRSLRESLGQGLDGWVDECLALNGPWDDVDVEGVRTSLTWYHAAGDRNCPISAARRLVDRLPDARFVEWPSDAGHFHGFHLEGAVLDELLARG